MSQDPRPQSPQDEEEPPAVPPVPFVEPTLTVISGGPAVFINSSGGPSANPLPPSPTASVSSALAEGFARRSPSSIRRSPSVQSLASTSSTTTLKKKSSMASVQGMAGGGSPRSSLTTGRRTSAGFYGRPPVAESEPPPPTPPLTAGMVAKEYLLRDLEAHSRDEFSPRPGVAVIFHDACYGHRYSRPRTSKASLSTIVERPERIRAVALGVSTAYVLLGDRHSDGKNAPHPNLQPSAAPFFIRKSSRRIPLSHQAVTNVHGTGWMAELQEMCEAAEARLTLNGKELLRTRGQSENGEEKAKLHEGDLYLCAESLEAFEGALGGVLDAVDTVFSPIGPRRCFACVRPPGHHCSSDYPSGFCWLNNVHVGISYSASSYGLTHAAIFDFDLHHGDGSQSMTWAHNAKVNNLPKNASISRKTRIGYFSLHDINSYPCEWGDEEKVQNASLCIENAHGQTVWNIHLQSWRSDAEFWELYNERYSLLLKKMRIFLRNQHEKFQSLGQAQKSKGAIFISAGFDASEWEGHGMQRHEVNVPTDFYARVTHDIVAISNEVGLGVDGRVISVLEGGYSDRALMSGALSHICGLTTGPATLVNENSIDKLTTVATATIPSSLGRSDPTVVQPSLPYKDEWWSPARLSDLENVGSLSPAAPVSRKPRGGPAPTYQSPTQSFVAKVVSPPTYQRSISGSTMFRQSSGPIVPARAPTPPPPAVEWTIASHELCKLLIPQNRVTRSCRPEDLNAKATEARRNRQSVVTPVPEVPIEEMQKMQLRDRKAKPPNSNVDEARPASSAARRRTISGTEIAEKDTMSSSRRRVSVASSILSNSDDTPNNDGGLPLDALNAPKQRGPGRPRVTKKAATRPNIPRVPSTHKHESYQQRQEVNPKGSTPSIKPPTAGLLPGQQSADTEMANLASGVKKMSIKLNVPSREEYEARQIQKQAVTVEPKKTTTARAPRKSVVKKAAKEPAKVMKSKAEPQAGGTELPMAVSNMDTMLNPKTIREATISQGAPKEHDAFSPPAPPINASHTSPIPVNMAGSETGMNLPSFQPPGPAGMTTTATAPGFSPLEFAVTSVDPAKISIEPASASEPIPLTTTSAPASTFASPKPVKQNLPIFSANGPIPFGSSPKTKPQQVLHEKSTNASIEDPAEEEYSSKLANESVLNGSS